MSKARPLTRANIRKTINLWTVRAWQGKKIVFEEDCLWADSRYQALDRVELPGTITYTRLTAFRTK